MSTVWGDMTVARAMSLWTFGRAFPVDGDRLRTEVYFDRLTSFYFQKMSESIVAQLSIFGYDEGMEKDKPLHEQCPSIEELRKYMMDDNGWTEEEWHQFSGYYFRDMDPVAGTTSLTRDQWSIRIMEYSGE
jgi:hypothetical protein